MRDRGKSADFIEKLATAMVTAEASADHAPDWPVNGGCSGGNSGFSGVVRRRRLAGVGWHITGQIER